MNIALTTIMDLIGCHGRQVLMKVRVMSVVLQFEGFGTVNLCTVTAW